MVQIKGNQVLLKEAAERDIDELYFWKYEDEEQEAKKWNGPYISEEKISKAEYRSHWAQEIHPGLPASLVILVNGKAIGYVGSYWVDKNTDWLETGIVIYDKNYWNGGYGSEAYALWTDHIFQNTRLHRLGMSTCSGNRRMIKVAEKLGMKEEARIREARNVNGHYFDAVKMGILRREWDFIQS
ncbi:GNAT family N-acetyltransferase [Halobacillus halophilus]|uniref:GNAT family N-acetyltransferase n=1 Tax=Halobacillus halophilus TaxID=1570 RepID=UPI001CD73436|nr:GNAT family protein [Halobacillus halophilus]MCA1010676.1 GNAT family N-acetyltransferase [Halobacillus halophilus]